MFQELKQSEIMQSTAGMFFCMFGPMFHPEIANMVHCLSPKRAVEIVCKCQCVGGPTGGTAL